MTYLLIILTIYLPMICTNPIRADGVLHLNCAPNQRAAVAWWMPAPGYIGSTSFYLHAMTGRLHVQPKALNTPVKGWLFGHYTPPTNYFLQRIGWASPLENVQAVYWNCLPSTAATEYTVSMIPTDEQIAALQAAGYGEYIAQPDDDDIASESFFFLSADDLERMTPEERERFGVVEMYEAMRDLPD